MAQKARPIGPDVSAGLWTPTPVYAQINALNFDPTDPSRVTSGNVAGDAFVVPLSGMAWPDQGPQSLSVRLRNTAGGSVPVTYSLLQGTALIAGKTVYPGGGFANDTLVLSDAQVALITDYTQLRLRVTAGYPARPACCPGGMAEVLTVTVSNRTGDCTCLPASFQLVWNGISIWLSRGGALACGSGTSATLGLRCAGTDCTGLQLFGPSGTFALRSCSCSPLSLVFDVTLTAPCAGGATFTVTE